MPSSRRSFARAAVLRRPSGPRCHGGASSLLRLGFGALPPRAASSLGPGWRERSDAADSAAVEHVVGWPRRADRAAALAS
jgi:hypothetical protein